MRIDNLRFGFACNSSSTHSVVFYPKGHKLQDDMIDEGEFGWQAFVAASETAKKSYLKALIQDRVRVSFGEETAKLVSASLVPDVKGEGYIDHQSQIVLPRVHGSNDIAYDFFRDLAAYVMRDGVVIHGGNDNGEDTRPPPTNTDWYQTIPRDERDDKWVCRREGDWWILFKTTSGTKVTLSFKDNPAPRVMAEVPELVDLKITDFCPYACAYCYQGSTHNGGHAEKLSNWLYALQTMGVFEVAIGGGEPTLHPDFNDLFQNPESYQDLQINFTTRNIDWLELHADQIRQRNCGFAVSVDEYHKALDITDKLKKRDLSRQASLQYVMGTASDWEFKSLLQLSKDTGLRLTLLGYKTTGRGETAKKRLPRQTDLQTGDGWINEIKESNCYNIAIDTALAARVPEDVFDEVLLRRMEGTHSMYIDAVAGKAGVSSYTDKGLIPVANHANSIEEAFKSLQATV